MDFGAVRVGAAARSCEPSVQPASATTHPRRLQGGGPDGRALPGDAEDVRADDFEERDRESLRAALEAAVCRKISSPQRTQSSQRKQQERLDGRTCLPFEDLFLLFSL